MLFNFQGPCRSPSDLIILSQLFSFVNTFLKVFYIFFKKIIKAFYHTTFHIIIDIAFHLWYTTFVAKPRCSAAGSAHGSGPWGPEFEPPHFDHKTKKHHSVLFCFIVVLAVRTLLFACENGVRLATKSKIARLFEAREVLRATSLRCFSALRPPMTKTNSRYYGPVLVIFVYIKGLHIIE